VPVGVGFGGKAEIVESSWDLFESSLSASARNLILVFGEDPFESDFSKLLILSNDLKLLSSMVFCSVKEWDTVV